METETKFGYSLKNYNLIKIRVVMPLCMGCVFYDHIGNFCGQDFLTDKQKEKINVKMSYGDVPDDTKLICRDPFNKQQLNYIFLYNNQNY